MRKPLRLVKPWICRDTIKRLQDLLKEAKTGEVVGFAYAAVNRQGDAHWGWGGRQGDEGEEDAGD